MVGKLHKSWTGGHVYMLVAFDKFTKWIKAAQITTQDSTAAVNFIKSLVFRFGVPHSIITDNGTNFTSKEFKDYCEGLGIKLNFASIAHPHINGQVKKANGLMCNGIKRDY
jgi:transposase InsO family protein